MVNATNIYSPESGVLCATVNTVNQNQKVDGLWRDSQLCPYFNEVSGTNENWTNYHAFYIVFAGKWMNGSRGDYIVKFLHSSALDTDVRAAIEQDGYAIVSKDHLIAKSGDIGAPGAYHVHMEVKKLIDQNWVLVDPYGEGGNDILWEY